jgi:hypothetical protein
METRLQILVLARPQREPLRIICFSLPELDTLMLGLAARGHLTDDNYTIEQRRFVLPNRQENSYELPPTRLEAGPQSAPEAGRPEPENGFTKTRLLNCGEPCPHCSNCPHAD